MKKRNFQSTQRVRLVVMEKNENDAKLSRAYGLTEFNRMKRESPEALQIQLRQSDELEKGRFFEPHGGRSNGVRT